MVAIFAQKYYQMLTPWSFSISPRIENSATNIADSIQQGGLPGTTGPVAPSLLEVGVRLHFLLNFKSSLPLSQMC